MSRRKYQYSIAAIEEIQRRARLQAILMSAFVCMMKLLPICANSSGDEFASLRVVVFSIWSLCFLVAMLLLLPFLLKRMTSEVSFEIENGVLRGVRAGRSVFLNVDLANVREVLIGNVRQPDRQRMRIVESSGKEIIINNLTEMDSFVSEIAEAVPVDIIYQEGDIASIIRRQKIVHAALLVIASALLFWTWTRGYE